MTDPRQLNVRQALDHVVLVLTSLVYKQNNHHINILSVYSLCSNGVGLPFHNIPTSRTLIKSSGTEFCPIYLCGVCHI